MTTDHHQKKEAAHKARSQSSISSAKQGLIEELINSNKVFVFMKGGKNEPECGFSAIVVQILQDVAPDYEAFNVLEDAAMRQAIKDYTQWPTLPQIFIDGKFIGGSDILQELYQSGELQKLLQ